MAKSLFYSVGLLSALALQAVAQTFTSCNPLNTTCPSDLALGVTNYTVDFGSSLENKIWNQTNGALVHDGSSAAFTINHKGDGPTVHTNFYIFFGVAEVVMKAAPGTGIVSSIVLLSDDLDEVDWEFLGGDSTHVETNFFGKGNSTTFDRAIYYPVEKPQEMYHNYTVVWTAEKLQWLIDGNIVRSLNYGDYHDGTQYPQTPMRLSLGSWVGGDPSSPKGTIDWAGGLTDYKQAPFTMNVKSVRVTDYSTGSAYTYGDHTGSWQSIKSTPGNSTIAASILAGPPPTTAEKWTGLSNAARIAIIVGVAAVLLASLLLFVFCCIKHKRLGRKEKAFADAEYDKNTAELMAYRKRNQGQGQMPGFGNAQYNRA